MVCVRRLIHDFMMCSLAWDGHFHFMSEHRYGLGKIGTRVGT